MILNIEAIVCVISHCIIRDLRTSFHSVPCILLARGLISCSIVTCTIQQMIYHHSSRFTNKILTKEVKAGQSYTDKLGHPQSLNRNVRDNVLGSARLSLRFYIFSSGYM